MVDIETAVISPKWQIVLPLRIREELRLLRGEIGLIVKHGILHLVPEIPLKEPSGPLPGLTTEGLRDKRDRF